MTTIEFKIENILEYPYPRYSEMAVGFTYTDLGPGNYSIFAYCYLGDILDRIFIESNQVGFQIIENKTNPNIIDEAGFGNGHAGFSNSFIALSITTFVVVIFLISTIFITSTEIGKFGFFGAVAPLYTKIRKKKKDHEYGFIKGSIRGYIVGNPGDNYSTIKRMLELPNGTLTYYLKVLEREGFIRSERDGFLKRFYPVGLKIKKEVLELTDTQVDIYNIIKEVPGIYQKDILARLKISQQNLSYHIQLMVKSRILKIEQDGNKTKCFIIEDVS
jgi:predicted transcriptional regulator